MSNPKEKKENKAGFNPDTPGSIDLLGFDLYIDTLAGLIKKPGFKTPFCLGVHGEWGSGKTTFMDRLADKLAKNGPGPRIVPVWFNPWRYSKEEHLIIPFLKTIEAALLRYTKENEGLEEIVLKPFKEGAVKMWRAAAAIAYGLKGEIKFGPLGGVTLDGSKMIDREEAKDQKHSEEAQNHLHNLSSLYYDIEDHLRSVVSGDVFRIAVFIDDLDRCMPEKALDLLEAVKLFLDMEGYLFVIGVAREVVEKGIAHHYRYLKSEGEKENPALSPEKYLEKMIQLPIDLPPVEPGKIKTYIGSLLKDFNEEYKKHADLIETGVGKNPRALKRFSNLLLFFDALANNLKMAVCADQEVNQENKELMKKYFVPLPYLKWSLIVHNFPRVYEEIKKDPKTLIKLQNAATGREKAPETGGEEGGVISGMDHRLKKILQKGEPEDLMFPDNDWLIARFVHLAEAAEIRSSERESSAGYTETFQPGDMVRIPKGKFLYGPEKLEKEIDYDYFMDVFPVTNKQYKEFIDDPENSEYAVPYVNEDWAKPYNWGQEKRSFPEGMENHPVVLVSHKDAGAYCQWRSQKEGKEFRLPTEEEWEKAARGTDGRKYPWGNEFDASKCNTSESKIGKTTPVGSYPGGASPYKCQDMAGNVWEWIDSGALRGGSWDFTRDVAGCACRFRNDPFGRYNGVGFRCARTLK
jgi:formylglycine-generating enzyme required for sulfatase activity